MLRASRSAFRLRAPRHVNPFPTPIRQPSTRPLSFAVPRLFSSSNQRKFSPITHKDSNTIGFRTAIPYRSYARKEKATPDRDSFAMMVKDKMEEEIDSGRLWWVAPVLATILLGLTAFYVSELWPIKKKEGEELDEAGEVDVIVSELVSIGLQLTLRRYSTEKIEKELIPKLSELTEHDDNEVAAWALDLLAIIAHRSKELSEKAVKHVELGELTKRVKKAHEGSKDGQSKLQRRFIRSYFELLAIAPRASSFCHEAIEGGAAEVLVDTIEWNVFLPRYRTLKYRAERSLFVNLLAKWIDEEEVRELVEKRGIEKVFHNDLASLSWLSMSIWGEGALSFNSLDTAIYEPLGRILKSLHQGGHKKAHDEGGHGSDDEKHKEAEKPKESSVHSEAKAETQEEAKHEDKEEKKHEEGQVDPIAKALRSIDKRLHHSAIPLPFQLTQERRHTRHEYLRGLVPFVLYSNIPVVLSLLFVGGHAVVVVTTPIAALWTTFLLLPGNGLKTYYLRDAPRRKPLYSFKKPAKSAIKETEKAKEEKSEKAEAPSFGLEKKAKEVSSEPHSPPEKGENEESSKHS